eukprot:3084829-Amphidinium_carterae.1
MRLEAAAAQRQSSSDGTLARQVNRRLPREPSRSRLHAWQMVQKNLLTDPCMLEFNADASSIGKRHE